ncbi:hypothetical protein B0H67DRAFT_331562 [Lasiosphaeris hirsuta]|uniref:Uncharacterized protein n=1 Tax=Lasiosphaeris hirsuta TaxID=260670 RepID=A0AA40A2P3_9PEZI|nr:hypothetical protein B0H67DRAFT_331562 [Lasiosphaeris hirsuta]
MIPHRHLKVFRSKRVKSPAAWNESPPQRTPFSHSQLPYIYHRNPRMHLSTTNLTLALATLGITNSPFWSHHQQPPQQHLLEMTTLQMAAPNGWHPGERAVHALIGVPSSTRANPTAPGLPPHYGHRLAASSLVALGTVDAAGRVW